MGLACRTLRWSLGQSSLSMVTGANCSVGTEISSVFSITVSPAPTAMLVQSRHCIRSDEWRNELIDGCNFSLPPNEVNVVGV